MTGKKSFTGKQTRYLALMQKFSQKQTTSLLSQQKKSKNKNRISCILSKSHSQDTKSSHSEGQIFMPRG